MRKIKDILVFILGITIILGIIGLLMAYSDGLLNGTFVEQIISIVFPALLGSYAITLVVSNLPKWITERIHMGFVFLISFVSLVLCIVTLDKDILSIIAITISSLVFITLIIFCLKELINKLKQ